MIKTELKKVGAVMHVISAHAPWRKIYEVQADIRVGTLTWAEDAKKQRRLVGVTAFFTLSEAQEERIRRCRMIMEEPNNRYTHLRRSQAHNALLMKDDPPKRIVCVSFRT